LTQSCEECGAWDCGTADCRDVLGLPTPDYRLPFEAEIGAHPSFEEMQVAVARNKIRPSFPDMWKNTNSVLLASLSQIILFVFCTVSCSRW